MSDAERDKRLEEAIADSCPGTHDASVWWSPNTRTEDIRSLLAENEALRAGRDRLREALGAADRILWMAEAYAEAGGSGGPEMRDYTEAVAEIRAALASGEEGR